MINNFFKFNEVYQEIRQYDRVITHGNLKFWGEEGPYNVDIEGQTGIVAHIEGGGYKMYGIVFDNYFFHGLTDLNRFLNVKRGLYVGRDQVEKIIIHKPEHTLPLQISKKAKRILEYCEYVNCPLYVENINYIDITDKNDTIFFIAEDRLERLGDFEEPWNSSLRQEMRVGRFIQLINPYTDQRSLDRKINLYKSTYNSLIDQKSNFRIVKGNEFLKWYREDHYQEGTGSLNKSCMRDKIDRLNLYVNNPDKVSMLILVNDDGKLEGRALIWNVDNPNITYMDRIYTVYQHDSYRFEEYARKNGWSYYDDSSFKRMIVHLGYNTGPPENNPYMDTFDVFFVKGEHGKFYLSNKYEKEDESVYYEYTHG